MTGKLFWVQEGTNEDRSCNTVVFSCEIERETPKTYIVKAPCLGSHHMKVINKNRIGTQFWHSEKEALESKVESIKRRMKKNPESAYLLGQLKNLDILLAGETSIIEN